MSFLTETVTRRLALSSRVALVQTPRQFSISARYQKSATETVKDAAKTVDRKVSDKLVDGINAACKSTFSTISLRPSEVHKIYTDNHLQRAPPPRSPTPM
jgi:hypothetical protein